LDHPIAETLNISPKSILGKIWTIISEFAAQFLGEFLKNAIKKTLLCLLEAFP
jgi:hypothetical protein